MIKTFFILAVTTMLMAGAIVTGCQSSAQKVDDAQSNVRDAKQDLKEAQKDANAEAQKAANDEAWKTFKSETEVKIRDNEVRVAELREKMKTSGKAVDALYAEKISTLEQKNRDMKYRMDAYEKGQSDWESFKREFNHDMDELGTALKDFTVNNKK